MTLQESEKKAVIKKKLKTYLATYQKKFIADKSRRIIVLKSRRIGLSESAAIKSVLKCQHVAGHDVHLVSRSFREAKELLRTAGKWARIYYKLGKIPRPRITATKIHFSNGSRVIALPSKAVRSRGGTVILDETADIQHAREVYDAVAPAVEADPDGQLILISTPLGKTGLFYEIWTDDKGDYGDWSKHFVDVHDAVEQGAHWLPDPEHLREQYPESVWRQEFCGEFLGDDDQFFSYALLRESIYGRPNTSALKNKTRHLAIDIGATKDASVACVVECAENDDGEKQRCLKDFYFIKPPGTEIKLHDQREKINSYIKNLNYPIDKIVVDGAGIGLQLAGELEDQYGSSSVITWDSGTWRKKPSEFVPLLKKDMEEEIFKIPGDIKVRDAFAAIKRKEYANRKAKYVAKRNSEHGHADLFFATLMAYTEQKDSSGEFTFVLG